MNRRILLIGGGALAALTAMLGWALAPPASPPARPARPTPSGAVVYCSPGYRISFFGLERLHPFDISKYDQIVDHLVSSSLLAPSDIGVPDAPSHDALASVHDPDYLASLHDAPSLAQALEVAVPGFVPGPVLERRVLLPMRRAVGGTVAAARDAIAGAPLAINLGGGYHHARPAMGHGFCIYNDVAYAIHVLRQEGFTGRVLILDTDAHQGDGNHAFFTDDPDVFTVSLQQAGIFPQPGVAGNRDVDLPAGTSDAAFLSQLDRALSEMRTRFQPDLVIHVAGADILSDDPLASLGVTVDGLVARDRRVLAFSRALGVPLVYLLAGGYGPSAARAQAESVAAMLTD